MTAEELCTAPAGLQKLWETLERKHCTALVSLQFLVSQEEKKKAEHQKTKIALALAVKVKELLFFFFSLDLFCQVLYDFLAYNLV